MSGNLFTIKQKDDQVVLTMLREAEDLADLQPFFIAFDNLFSDENMEKVGGKLYVFCDCSKIEINPMFIRLNVVKSICEFLMKRKEVLQMKIAVCSILISSKILSLTVSALLSKLSIVDETEKNKVMALEVSHDKDICKDFLKTERAKRTYLTRN